MLLYLQDEGFSKTKGCDFLSSEKRYPVKRAVYMQTVGRLLPRRISQILKEINPDYTIWINPNQGNGIDLKVWYNNDLIIVGEILNWSIKSRLAEKRRENMISNLHEFPCRKLLICTTLEDNHVSRFIQNGIDIIGIGYQLLPRYYYNFFLEKEQVDKRMIDHNSTKEDIKNKIIVYLKKHFSHIGI